MESLDAQAGFIEDLLDFSSDIGEEEEEDDDESRKAKTLTALPLSLLSSRGVKTSGIVEEEELEWISNKDAFPMVETFVDIMPNHHHPSNINNHQSPVSVLENSTSSFTSNTSSGPTVAAATTTTAAIISLSSNLKVPVGARSKRKKRRMELFSGQQWQCWAKETTTTHKIAKPRGATKQSSTLGRKCLHCQAEKTPQWRAGPMGPKTLCNACGVRYKSGRLVPEYRPASSPTFSSEVHSNSHRKIIEMRKQKQPI